MRINTHGSQAVLTSDYCSRCRLSDAYACWEFSSGFTIGLCMGCDIELTRRLLQSLGSEDWESRFVDYIAEMWVNDMELVPPIPTNDPLAKTIFCLEAEGKWPPAKLLDHKDIVNWVETETTKARLGAWLRAHDELHQELPKRRLESL